MKSPYAADRLLSIEQRQLHRKSLLISVLILAVTLAAGLGTPMLSLGLKTETFGSLLMIAGDTMQPPGVLI